MSLYLKEKGINQWNYPWNLNHIQIEIKEKRIFKFEDNNDLIGTFSLKKMNGNDYFRVFENDLYLYRIAILPKNQGKNQGKFIIDYIKTFSKKNKTSIFLDCWEGNQKLNSFYSENGFDYIGKFPEEDYFISVFKYN